MLSLMISLKSDVVPIDVLLTYPNGGRLHERFNGIFGIWEVIVPLQRALIRLLK